MTAAYTGTLFSGGLEIDGFVTSNLTIDSSSRIFTWSREKFIDPFREGKLLQGTPMSWNSFKRMNEVELVAIYNI